MNKPHNHHQGAFMTQTERKRSTKTGRLLTIFFILAALFGLSGVALAQIDQASVSGTVHDQNKAVVTGATVTVKNDRTGDVRTATAKEDGSFTIRNLKPSTYTITVTAQNI